MWNPFHEFFPELTLDHLTGSSSTFKEPGVLLLWGGSDVHPSLYGRSNIMSHVKSTISVRDHIEVSLLERAIKENIPVIGVCRGAQLVCAAAGGILIQDVDGHGESHPVMTKDGELYMATSTHHQMMYPWGVEHKLIAWSAESMSSKYIGITQKEQLNIPKIPLSTEVYEPEIVWFPEIKALAIQGHPEYEKSTTGFNQYIKKLIYEYISPLLMKKAA